jgi:hypothetical protein
MIDWRYYSYRENAGKGSEKIKTLIEIKGIILKKK